MAEIQTGRVPAQERQQDVHRLLGRYILRVQHYEKLLKAVLAHHEFAGPLDAIEAYRARHAERLADKTLGTLVKALFDNFVVPDGFEREPRAESKLATAGLTVAFSSRLSMSPELWSETKAAIEDMVSTRNALVHDFIGKFDLSSDEGCAAAVTQLEQSYQRVDRHYAELVDWATSFVEVERMAAQFAQTSVFKDLLFNGINPDGSFEWPHTGIVRALRHASHQLSENGWTRLDDARDWIAEWHSEQTPEKYGRRSWPQVLTESRVFDLRYRISATGDREAWFRARD